MTRVRKCKAKLLIRNYEDMNNFIKELDKTGQKSFCVCKSIENSSEKKMKTFKSLFLFPPSILFLQIADIATSTPPPRDELYYLYDDISCQSKFIN